MTQQERKKDEKSELVKLIQEAIPGELLRVFENSVQRIIDAELSMLLGADSYERTADRTNYRNGYRARKELLSTPMGPVTITIPKLRKGSFYPSILKHYQRVDRALLSIICEAYFNGVSTRKMNNLFVDLGLRNIDRSLVSRCASQIDDEVQVWRNRPLERRYAYIWLDAIYTKAGQNGA